MNRSNVRVLRMRGLPFSACNSDITEFFRDYNVEDVRIGMRQGKPTGEAFVRFSDERNCSDALAQLDKQMLGKRYIELFKAKDQDLESSLPEVSISGKCNVIRMRGLPFSACIGDILDFFKNVPALDTENIYFVYDSSGRPSGEAYISFLSSDACAAAMKLHKNKMGSRYIELFPSSSVDLQRAAKQRKLRLAKIDGTSAKAQLSAKHADLKAIKLQCQGEPTAKQQSSEKPAQAAPASAVSPSTVTTVPTAPPLRRTFASITAAPPAATVVTSAAAAPTPPAAPVAATAAPQPMPPPASSPPLAHQPEESLAMKLGALEMDVRPHEQQGISPLSAEAEQNTAAAAAAAVLDGGNSLTGDCAAMDMSSYALPQATHVSTQHVAARVGLPDHDMMGPHAIPKNGMGHSAMASGSVMPPQPGGYVQDQMSGYHRHGVLSGTAGGYALHRGADYGGVAGHAMLAGGNHMQYSHTANMQFSGGAHMASPQLRPPPGQPPAAGNNRQNVPPNVPPPMPHDEVWNMWGQPSVPGGIRDLWQTDMGVHDPKKSVPQSFGNIHHNGQFTSYNMGPAQHDFGFSHNPAPYYPTDGRQGNRKGYREF